MSASLLIFDYDKDTHEDIYFLNGAPLPGSPPGDTPRNRLYRNLGDWKFVDVTGAAGVGDPGYGLGVAAADVDNNGFEDVYVNNLGPNVFYRNNGDGTFSDATEECGVRGGDQMGAGVCFLDADRDGWVDLYVGNYIDFSFDRHIARSINGIPSYPGPLDYQPIPDTFYHNNGDGTFRDASETSGIGTLSGTCMGLVGGDFDNDGDTDIFVCNDVKENFLWINDGTGRFQDNAIVRGVAYDAFGAPQASMGADCGDLDNDGLFDLFMTSYQNETVTFYRNLGAFFEDATATSGAGVSSYSYVTWGVVIADFDNDGFRDVFIACGHLDDNVELRDRTTSYWAKNILLKNLGNGKFEDVSGRSGPGLQVRLSSRGAAAADLDNDGDLDIVVLNSRMPATVLRNDTPSRDHWLQVRLDGRASNRSAIGARVDVTAGDLRLADEVRSGRGYQSDWGRRLHFGLGPRTMVDRVEVRWPSGNRDVLENVPGDRLIYVVEGQSPASDG
ncbi:MAG: CRTAC1 family protein [Thermogutta sp.]|nr:CRTAC1 family protein [Thermogutta sp.]